MEKSKCCGAEKRLLPNGHGYQCCKCNKDEELLTMNQTNNRIREEWKDKFDGKFGILLTKLDNYYAKDLPVGLREAIKSFISELLKSQKESLVEKIPKIIDVIENDLNDRRGLKLSNLDENIQTEIREKWSELLQSLIKYN